MHLQSMKIPYLEISLDGFQTYLFCHVRNRVVFILMDQNDDQKKPRLHPLLQIWIRVQPGPEVQAVYSLPRDRNYHEEIFQKNHQRLTCNFGSYIWIYSLGSEMEPAAVPQH